MLAPKFSKPTCLSSFMAQNLDWSLWIGLLAVVMALGLVAHRATSVSTPHFGNDPYGVMTGDAVSGEPHSRVETGS